MNKADTMLGYVPQFIRAAQAYKAIIDAEGAEFDQVQAGMVDILGQFYVETATWGLDLWEQMLNLKTDPGKPYSERRSNIIAKLRGVGTVNVALLKSVAESYTYGIVSVVEDPGAYSFVVKFVDARGIPPNLADVEAAIEEIKPAHLAVTYEFTYTVWDELLSTTWGQLLPYTWGDVRVREWS